ncbi:L,D-transpeptidase family protein [Prosthecobacter sp.]|uniref:L,D-transpeptidase family protein n=1 Tax=Prosthecobacter sp. TaxID=1965333 RepID=UPI001D5E1E98|nr:L,D-transpeptidase family protein [Prosthecobacter sp.]MCB1276822.1 L,D-transpeptidase family protein [Prosthecobacter sp.]
MNSVRQIAALCRFILLAGLLLCGVGCSTPEKVVAENPLSSRAWWKGDGVAGKPRIVINLSTQRVQYYKGGELVGVSPISSGRESHGTVTGTYHIMEKDLHHRSSRFGVYVDKEGNVVQDDVDTAKDSPPAGTHYVGANMRYFMRIVGGIGMHEGYLPGYPASHGCIRLPTKMAAIFFNETPEGTPVQIVGAGSLAATEAAIPIGMDEAVPVAPVDKKKKAKEEVVTVEPVDDQKLTVRRAIVADAEPKSSFGSLFNWSRRVPLGTTVYLDQNSPPSARYKPARLRSR